MKNWVANYWKATRQTKFFVWNWIIYGILLILTTAYCYLRLDYVRSYKMPQSTNESHP